MSVIFTGCNTKVTWVFVLFIQKKKVSFLWEAASMISEVSPSNINHKVIFKHYFSSLAEKRILQPHRSKQICTTD